MAEYSLLAMAIVTADGTDAIDPRLVPGDSVSSEPMPTVLHRNRYEEWRPRSDPLCAVTLYVVLSKLAKLGSLWLVHLFFQS